MFSRSLWFNLPNKSNKRKTDDAAKAKDARAKQIQSSRLQSTSPSSNLSSAKSGWGLPSPLNNISEKVETPRNQTGGTAPSTQSSSSTCQPGLSRSEYIRLLFRNNIFSFVEPKPHPATRDELEKRRIVPYTPNIQPIVAAEQRVNSYKVPEDEAREILERTNRKMKEGVCESKSSVSGDDEMEVEEDLIEALVQARLNKLNENELDEIKALFKKSPSDRSVVIDKFNVSFTVADLLTLRPNTWLNDEVVNFYMELLRARDERLFEESNGTRRKSHYFNSFFMSKLLEGGVYCYGNVKRWSRKFDIFSMDRVFIPINLNNTHWVLAVVDITQKEIHYYDSMSGGGTKYLDAILKWLADEAKEKKKMMLNTSEWSLFEREEHVPQQMNGYDCGVFSIVLADFLSDRLPLRYSQDDMAEFRNKIAAAIRRGSLLY